MKFLATTTSSSSSSSSTTATTPRPPPPIVDVQDVDADDTQAHEAEGGAHEEDDLAQQPPPAPPEEKPRKLSRGASIKSLFGAGSRPPKTTPAALSPCATPRGTSSPSRTPRGATSPCTTAPPRQFLQVGNPSSIFRLPKPQVKLLKKTASVKQLYNSVLHALKTIASARDDITPELTKTFFENILRASEEGPELVVTKVKVDDAKELGRHFCSEVHTVEVTAKVGGLDSQQRVYHLVVKSQPQDEDARKFLQPGQTFEKEVQMYAQVFHDMANFVRRESVISLNCKDSEVIDVPRCFYTRWAGDDNVKEDLIILENLYPQGFSFARHQDNGLDRRHSELVIRELAKFHAISFCMKQGSNAALLERYPYLSEDSLYRPSTEDFTKRTITPVMASLAELLRTRKGYEEHYEWFVDLARNFHHIQMDMVRPRNNFAVICHGDLWLSNVLFRYEPATATCASSGAAESVSPAQMPAPAPNVFFGEGEVPTLSTLTDDSEPGRPIEVKFLDFQSARFASLATDLILFLFTSVKNDLRRTMLGELISLYYTTFLVSVRSLNVAEDIFSMEELFIEIEQHIIYGFLEGIWYLDIVHGGHVPKSGSDEEDDERVDIGEDDIGDEDDDDENNDSGGDSEYEEFEDSNSLMVSEDEHDKRRRPQKRRKKHLCGEAKEQMSYREEFFELLDEVLFLLGKAKPSPRGRRRLLRDTSLRFHGRNASFGGAGTPAAVASEDAIVVVTENNDQ